MSRIKIEVPDTVLTKLSIPVRITDINYGNHVGNDSLVGMVQEARVLWLKQGGYDELNIEGQGLIMSDLAMEYKSESFYGDTLDITLSVNRITRASFDLYFSISARRNNAEILIARAKTGMVCFDYSNRKVTALPERFLAFLQP
jgi:acyl-CoA thioester hydrolase